MALLTVVLVVGSVVRLGLLFGRPAAGERFRHPRRRLLATRVEQGGDLLLLLTAACMVVFGYGSGTSLAVPIWLVCLLGGLAMVAFAHDVARRHRPDGSTSPRGPRPDAGARPRPAAGDAASPAAAATRRGAGPR